MYNDDYHDYEYDQEETAAHSIGSGCLPGFIIPPAAVLIFGLLMLLFTRSIEVSADSPIQIQATAQTSADAQPAASAVVQPTQAPAVTQKTIAPLFTPEVQFWSNKIMQWSAETGLDPNLVATIMQIESCGDPQARSGAGAMGLFQVMPYHFMDGENPYDPDTNAKRGLGYMLKSLDRANQTPRLAFAGYNGGIGVIGRSESSWAAETVRYAYWGSGIYQDAIHNQTSSARLTEWLGRGGASLCRQASQRLGLP